MILRAYIDDSGVNQPPVSILAGWVAAADRWAALSDDWQRGLEMKPALQYFKMTEAMGFGGEFAGWSVESRDHRLRYFINIIEEHQLFAIGTAVHTKDYQSIFRGRTDRFLDVPYFLMFHSLVAGLVTQFAPFGLSQVDFVFDEQPGQMERISGDWVKFKSTAPERFRHILGEAPIFRSDKTTVALQAADLYAWFLRAKLSAELEGEVYSSPWGRTGDRINTMTLYWSRQQLQRAFDAFAEANRRGVPVEIWREDD